MDHNKDSTFHNYPKRPLQSKSAAPVSAEDNSNKMWLLHSNKGAFFATFKMCLWKTLKILQEHLDFREQYKTFTMQYLSVSLSIINLFTIFLFFLGYLSGNKLINLIFSSMCLKTIQML